MSSEFDIALEQLKNVLYENDVIKNYLKTKKALENNNEIQELLSELRKHQRLMCKNVNNDEIYSFEKEKYLAIKEELNLNPLYQNFTNLQNEVDVLLKEVRDYLK